MKSFLLAATSLLLANSAFAADAVYEVPQAPVATEAPATFSWTGGYLGVQGGYGWTDSTLEAAGAPPLSVDFDGGILGAFAGYNYQFDNNFVVGIEGDLEHNWNKETFGTALGDASAETNWQGSVRGRVGYAFDRAMIYASAGWAATHVDATVDTGAGVFKDDATLNGYTVGGGVDYAITDNVFARVDYRFNDFGSKGLNFGGTGASADLKQHTVKVGVGVKF